MQARNAIFHTRIARILFLIPGILLLCLFEKCDSTPKHKVSTGFYYWKTNFRLNADDKAILTGTGASTVYLRLFDVDWDPARQKATPVGVLQSAPIPAGALHYIPVVYITQSCLKKLSPADLPELSAHIHTLISSLCTTYHIDPAEIQIDCDWTKNSADIYFSLLRQLKATAFFTSRILSCTIRLHQVKFVSGSGIPPVDRGLLMVYNMGNLTRYGGHNSILDAGEAKRYLKHLDIYPLPLDVALPVYHWAVLFEHKQFKGITYNISKPDFAATAIAQQDEHLYRILQDCNVRGYRFTAGQEIRFEAPDVEDLKETGSFLREHIKDSSFRLSFFHLDSRSLKPFTIKDLNDIANTLR